MPLLTELPKADLRAAGDAIETLIEYRACLPPAELLIMLAGKFRDDIRDALGMPLPERASRGQDVRPLGELASGELDKLFRAVGVLVGRFTPWMDDPELIASLSGLHQVLSIQASERARLAEEVSA
jgi:hypothetical protein